MRRKKRASKLSSCSFSVWRKSPAGFFRQGDTSALHAAEKMSRFIRAVRIALRGLFLRIFFAHGLKKPLHQRLALVLKYALVHRRMEPVVFGKQVDDAPAGASAPPARRNDAPDPGVDDRPGTGQGSSVTKSVQSSGAVAARRGPRRSRTAPRGREPSGNARVFCPRETIRPPRPRSRSRPALRRRRAPLPRV